MSPAGSGTGTPAVTGVAVGFTPAQELAELKIIFGATASGSTDRVTVITNCLKRAAALLWNYAAWQWRHRQYDVSTVADQSYTALPSDYCRVAEWGDWLVDTSDGCRPTYLSPADFKVRGAILDDRGISGDVEFFTVTNREIAGVWTPVIEWIPTPSTVKVYTGFHDFRAMPVFDETSENTFFPNIKFDLLWHMLAVRMSADSISQVEVRGPSWTQINRDLGEALGAFQWHPSAVEPHDAYGDTDDLRFPYGGGQERYDSDGKLLMG